jgi:hypothetical protein
MVTLFARPLCGMCDVMKHWLSSLNVALRQRPR